MIQEILIEFKDGKIEQCRSKSEVARKIGCSAPWVTYVLENPKYRTKYNIANIVVSSISELDAQIAELSKRIADLRKRKFAETCNNVRITESNSSNVVIRSGEFGIAKVAELYGISEQTIRESLASGQPITVEHSLTISPI